MLLQTVPTRQGLQWVLQGMRTFWRQPLAMSGLFFLFMALVSLVSMLPFIGGVLALVLMPSFTAGLMAATQIASEGRFPMPGTVWLALRPGPQRTPMLQLGAIYATGFLLMMGASVLVDGGQFARVYLGGEPLRPELVQADSFQAALWVSMLLYMPLSVLFWHAPALVFWQGVSPVKSLFFSWMGCWRNKGAFLVYGLAWAAVFGSAAVVAMVAATLLGDPQMTLSIMMPLALLVAAMFFTSMLFTVKDCFSTTGPRPD
ncbi:MAG: BPSS1780 family membrane protein [Limnohabitans sp.]